MISPTPSMSLRPASRKAVDQEHVDARGPLRPFLFKSGLETPCMHYDEPPCADPHVVHGVRDCFFLGGDCFGSGVVCALDLGGQGRVMPLCFGRQL